MRAQRREPNPFNSRAARVAGALSDYAASVGRSPAALTRSEIRTVLQQRGLYSSEGSLSRDLAAIRKNVEEFGGARTAWATTNRSRINIDGEDAIAVRFMTAPDSAWRGKVTIGAVAMGRLWRVTILATGDAGADRARALNALIEKIESERQKRERRIRRAAYVSRCQVCGVREVDIIDENTGLALCEECAEELEQERQMLDDWSDLDDQYGNWDGPESWDDYDARDLDIRVIAREGDKWARGGRWRDS